MRSRFYSISIASALALAGCAAPTKPDNDADANRVAHDRMLCGKYGYDAGSDEFAQCMRTLAERREESTAKRTALAAHSNNSNGAATGCESRNEVIAGGSRSMPKEGAGEKCGH